MIKALEVGFGQNGAQQRQESMTALASIQEFLSVISFNPISDGLSLIDVTGGAGGGGMGRGGAVDSSSTKITVVLVLVDGGSRASLKTAV